MQDGRLFKIVYHLINKGQATAGELACMFEVSVRTIYRDIDVLSQAGIPIYASSGRNGGIKLLDSFTLSRMAFTQQEKSEIMTGLCSLSIARYPEASGIISKLSALFQMDADNWIDVDLTRWGSVKDREQKLFLSLRTAVVDMLQIEFDYFNSSGSASKRSVEPGKLVYRDKAWYLYGFCLERRDWRLFRLTRIRNLMVTDIHHDRKCEKIRWEAAENYGPMVNLSLQFHGSAAYRLYDVFDEEAVAWENGSIWVTAAMPETEWLYGFLMSFGSQLMLVEPEHVKHKLTERYTLALNQLLPDSAGPFGGPAVSS